MNRWRIVAALMLLGAAGVQGQQPSPAPVPRKRALEIRGQAPAPEVVTVRPRTTPAYTRKLIAPALYDPPAGASARAAATVVLLPGTLSAVRPPATTPSRPPE